MDIDLDRIRSKNQIEYGTGNKHLDLLRSIYPERTHFVFELIQNAADADATEVDFRLFAECLHFVHNGRPFDARDVEAICRIAEGTKSDDVSKVGKFGIGFKSVYNYTSRPEIYSSGFSFCIQDYVRPYEIPPKTVEEGKTFFIFPFNRPDFPADRAVSEISQALASLDRRNLIFLTSIRSITWRLPNSRSGELKKSVLSSKLIQPSTMRPTTSPLSSIAVEDSAVSFSSSLASPGNQGVSAVSQRLGVAAEMSDTVGLSAAPERLVSAAVIPQQPPNTDDAAYQVDGANLVNGHTATYQVISLSSAGRYAEQWHVFSSSVDPDDIRSTARVDLAFLQESGNLSKPDMESVDPSFLHVCFSTHKKVSVGYLINGPFYTTPARDNLDNNNNERNQEIVKASTELLKMALLQFKKEKLITGNTLRTLALSQRDFPKGDIFRTVFEGTRRVLLDEEILPTLSGSHAAARSVVIPGTTEIRNLFGPEEIASLFRMETAADWLAPSIADKQELSQYLETELGIRKITVEEVTNVLDERYLTRQPDEWIVRFYAFCQKQQPSIIRKLRSIAIVRLEDGSHVVPISDSGKLNAYFPMKGVTGLPFVKATLIKNGEARAFLQQMGITEPDDVHDTLTKIIPQLQASGDALPEEEVYVQMLRQIMFAFQQADRSQTILLESKLRTIPFLRGRHSQEKSTKLLRPQDLYNPADRLVNFFKTASNVWFPDLPSEAQGLLPYLQPLGLLQFPAFVRTEKHALTIEELRHIEPDDRLRGKPTDYELKGLEEFMQRLRDESQEQKLNCARILWKLLSDMTENQDPPRAEVPRDFRARITIDKAKPKWLKILQREVWLPDARFKFNCAADISVNELPHEFVRNKKLANLLEMKDVVLGLLSKETGIPANILDFVRLNPEKISELMGKVEGVEHDLLSPSPDPVPVIPPKATASRAKGSKSSESFFRTPVPRSSPKKESITRPFLLEQYGGTCQICSVAGFPTLQGEPFFEAVYIVSGKKGQEVDMSGNVVSVCAMCSARLLYGKVSTPDNLLVLLRNIDTHSSDELLLNISLGDERCQISFSSAHKEQVRNFIRSEVWNTKKS